MLHFVSCMICVLVLVQAVLQVGDIPTQSADDNDLPSSSNCYRSAPDKSGNQEQSEADVSRVDWRSMWEIMFAQFLLGSATLIYRADFAVTVSQRYGTSNTANGYISSLASIVGTLTGFAVGHIASIYAGNSHRLFLHAAVAQTVAVFVAAIAPTVMLFSAGHILLAFACAVSRVAAMQTMLDRSSQKHIGTLIGTGATVLSVARMLAPAVSGVSQEVLSYYGPVILSVVLSLAGTIVLLIMPSKPDIKAHMQ